MKAKSKILALCALSAVLTFPFLSKGDSPTSTTASTITVATSTQASVASTTQTSSTAAGSSADTSTLTSVTGGLQMGEGLQFRDIIDLKSGISNDVSLQTQQPGIGRLIKLAGSSKIYWENENGYKMLVPTLKILASYGAKPASAQEVSKVEFDNIPFAEYIKLKGNFKIYKVSGNVKRLVPIGIWQESGLEEGLIVIVNKSEFYYYKLGKTFKNVDELFPENM